jgi:polar amino acid transport system permease protein
MDQYLNLISFGPGGWGALLLKGAGLTLALAVTTLPLGLALGLGVAMTQRSRRRWLRAAATAFTTIFRALPELLTLYLVYFGLTMGLRKLSRALGIESFVELPPFTAGVIALGLVVAAFSSEVWVSALMAIPPGQREAARAVGLSVWRSFRLVELPQLWRVALPGIGNCWMTLLKDTSLVSVITLPELMYVTSRANVVTKQAFFFFGFASLIYLGFSLVSMAVLARLEWRAARGIRGR